MGWASGFQAGSRLAGDILDIYEKSKQRREFEEISKAAPTQEYTAEQGLQLQNIASATREDGTPYYNVTPNAQGLYDVRVNPTYTTRTENNGLITTTPDFPAETVAYTPGRQMFLGRAYNQGEPLTQEQMDLGRMQSYADAVTKYDPIQGLRMRRDLAAEQRAAKAEGRAEELFGLNKQQLEQSIASGALALEQAKTDADKKKQLNAVENNISKFTEQFTKNKDGSPREMTLDEQTKVASYSAQAYFSAGDVKRGTEAANLFTNAALNKINLDTAIRSDALIRAIPAVQAGDINAAVDFYNRFTPDGATVTGIKENKDGSIRIMRVSDADGQKLPDTIIAPVKGVSARDLLVAQMQTFKDPMAFRNFVTQNAKDDLARRVSESQINANNLRGAQADAEIKRLKLKQEEENKLIKLRDEFFTLSKDPRTNANRLRQISGELAILSPKYALKFMTVKDVEGNEIPTTVNMFDSILSNALRAAGVVELPQQAEGALEAAAANSRGNRDAFLRSRAAQSAMQSGASAEDLVSEFLTRQQPAKTNPQNPGLVRNLQNEVPAASYVAP